MATVELLTIPETAKRLRVGRSSVYRLIHAGELRTTNVGTAKRPRLRLLPESVDEFIARRAAPTKKRGRAA